MAWIVSGIIGGFAGAHGSRLIEEHFGRSVSVAVAFCAVAAGLFWYCAIRKD